ncbi:ScbA/BarX family gamma-butyrolactone biosynthesis protein [Allostreptomyces psammosilenae]|uniref:A-factor biosynthesis hotdog domain-containing protein n=1 Tax=Allostreptomyces psammosilenae TaxID=1892865 RepID=A0A853A4E3_9ACTN|nr:ScbA/BarX family gamma-butyrolactone biosynthesis protein [Allostreptomyces psammosilenae]NYI05368.1 hypothetical protein [Allostreptomyces psammosilenae]
MAESNPVNDDNSTTTTTTTPVTDDSPVADLSFDATVPRKLVHRAAVAEVFVTDSAETGPDRFDVAAQLPRAHVIGESSAFYDLMLLVEVGRQSGVLIAHRHYDIELDSAFIFRRLSMRVVDHDALRVGPKPAHVVVRLRPVPVRNKAGRVQGFSYTGTFLIDGRLAVEATGELLFVRRAAWKVLRTRGRGAALPADGILPRFVPAAPASVGRQDARNVVLTEPTVGTEGTASALLVVDLTHPHLFDHPLDHVPGNLEIEAARQLAVAAVARINGMAPDSLVVTDVEADFGDFAELDRVTRVQAQLGQFLHDERLGVLSVPATVELKQNDKVMASIRLEVAQCR